MSQDTNGTQAVVEVRVPFALQDALGRPGLLEGHDARRAARYTEALITEIRANAGQFDDLHVAAVRFCGGQATSLGDGLYACLRELRRCVDIAPDATISVQAGLSDFNAATATWFMRMRATRFDLESLSLDPIAFGNLLPHDRLGAIPLIKEGFLQIPAKTKMGYVLAFGYDLPGHANTAASLARCLRLVTSSDAEHVILARASKKGLSPVPEHVAAAQLVQARRSLLEAGFCEYLPLLFARPGREDPYFARIAKGCPRIGFGSGATTLISGIRSLNTFNVELYCEKSADFRAITTRVERVDNADKGR